MKLRLLAAPDGRVTFYMDSIDGFGSKFLSFLRKLGIQSASCRQLEIVLPKNGTQYWSVKDYYVPLLTNVHYAKGGNKS